MAELFTLIAAALMILAVVGSFVPMMPGALLSILGILVYWYGTGFTRPSTFFLVAFILTSIFAVAMDYFSGVIAAKAGGASARTSIIAGAVGFLLFFVLGPLGILLGVVGTVFIRQYLLTGEKDRSLRTAAYSAAGVLGSAIIQFLVTVSLLVAFLITLVV